MADRLGELTVLATSFERIHRANLIGMGVLPVRFMPGQSAKSLGLTGEEIYSITGLLFKFVPTRSWSKQTFITHPRAV